MINFYNSVRGLLLEESSTKKVTVGDIVGIFDTLLEFEVREAERLRLQSLFDLSDDGFQGTKHMELHAKYKVPGFEAAFREWTVARLRWRDIYKREVCGLRISRGINPYNPEPISAIESEVARAAAQQFVDAKSRYLAFLDKLSAPIVMAPADIPVRTKTVQANVFKVFFNDLFKNSLSAFGETNRFVMNEQVTMPLPYHRGIDIVFSCRDSYARNYHLTLSVLKDSVEFMRAMGDVEYERESEITCSWRAQIVDNVTGRLVSNEVGDILSFLENKLYGTNVIQVDVLPDL